jgi:hypothetical protein
MRFEYGNIWSTILYQKTHLLLITTNATITTQGKLVMGRGLAAEAKRLIPGVDEEAARVIAGRITYGFVKLPRYPKLGLFQVKYHYAQRASLDLIQLSTNMLKEYALQHPERIDLNYPGIGNGGLNKRDVYPIISQLPDNVHIWQYDKPRRGVKP